MSTPPRVGSDPSAEHVHTATRRFRTEHGACTHRLRPFRTDRSRYQNRYESAPAGMSAKPVAEPVSRVTSPPAGSADAVAHA
jgi:hypothetical protein